MTELTPRTNYWLLLLRLIAYVSAGVVLYGIIASPFVLHGAGAPKTQRLLQFIGVTCIFLLPSWLFAIAVEKEPLEHFKLKTYPKAAYLLVGIVLVFVAEPFIAYTTELNNELTLPASMAKLENLLQQFEKQAEQVTMGLLVDHSYIGLFSNLLIMAALPALAEEIFFRGVLQQFFIRWTKSIHTGVWLAAFWFSFLHFQFYGFIPRLLLGVMLGYLFVTSRSLWPNVLFHLINNSIFVLVAFFDLEHSGFAFFSENYHFPVYLVAVSLAVTVLVFVVMHKKNVKDGSELDKGVHHE
jgi:membrane protease YdiL (CAAX protease family)